MVSIDGYREAVDVLTQSWSQISGYMRTRVIMRFMGAFELEPKYFNRILAAKLGELFPNFGKITSHLELVFNNYDKFLENVTVSNVNNIDRYNHSLGGVPDNTDDAILIIRKSLDSNYHVDQYNRRNSVSNVVKLAYEPSSARRRTFPWMWDVIKDKVAVGEFGFLADFNGMEFVAWLFEYTDKDCSKTS